VTTPSSGFALTDQSSPTEALSCTAIVNDSPGATRMSVSSMVNSVGRCSPALGLPGRASEQPDASSTSATTTANRRISHHPLWTETTDEGPRGEPETGWLCGCEASGTGRGPGRSDAA
jgi:hypothetical protein